MTTEQYQIGYEAGYSDGFDAGAKPAQNTSTVPRATWGAVVEALEWIATASHEEKFSALDMKSKAREALTAANAVQPQAQGEAITLQRWGRAENLCLRLLDPMDDGYWTPWHIAQEAIDSLQKKIFHPQATEPAWRPIESAPKDGTEIIGCWPSYIDSGSFARVTCKYVGWSWVTTDFMGTELAQPTYWMPLPAAPEAHHGK